VIRPTLFYRASEMQAEELQAAQEEGFHCIDQRTMVQKNDFVVGRYSVLPYYKETEEDIRYMGGTLINTLRQHLYIADLRNWAEDLGELTPKTWYRMEDFVREFMFHRNKGPFVLKGQTNSRKDRWKTHMHAANVDEALQVYERLLCDGFLRGGERPQEIYIREYVPLVTYAKGISDLPITKEFRLFVYKGEVLTGGFYWSSWGDTCREADPKWEAPRWEEIPWGFLNLVLMKIQAPFYVVDIAQDDNERWWVVDVNDGQMSGLSGNDPKTLYFHLFNALTR
jgi:hypothetical protein